MKKGTTTEETRPARDVAPQGASSLTRAQRKHVGRQARQETPRESQSTLNVAKERDPIENIEASNRGRIPELIPVRHGRMLVSPFTFFRGSAALMTADLASTPTSGIIVQACGDCHIQNFGAFATPERKIVVDINDFDETLPAPWEWDLKRLAVSLVLAAESNGFSLAIGREAALEVVKGYREHIARLSEMSLLERWYSHVEIHEVLASSNSESRHRQEDRLKAEMKRSSPEILMDKLTVTKNGSLRFKDLPPLLCHMEGVSTGEQERQAFQEYRNSLPDDRRVLLDKFEIVDIARKVVGIGSVGTMCGVILLASSENDVLVLQVKEARESVLAPFAGASRYDHQGQRVVNGQKLMQAASDMFLGWTTGPRPPYRHFFLRQLRDVKIGVNTVFWTKADFRDFPRWAGEILARAHSRSGDAAILRGYIGKSEVLDEAIASYAVAYAEQTVRDYHKFVSACKSGRLDAQSLD